ncbi:hypothetical protein [Sphingobacterium paucimobilis]|uniref:Uncharacterized protein n=1 Tax=Sphingobacterium paucimobilis HER1398 TaxID=1346330 RepID=U2HZI0_9SPHI|nr:hypothetical protein [Sphingobacterium paucimobilis]ERJ60962.1 hypothetical protein M472_19595 [Sphingobacterium paucimobilis HER1398]
MKKCFLTTLGIASAILVSTNIVLAQAKKITQGNLVIYRIGDANSSGDINSDKACPIYLDEYKLSVDKADLVQSIALPSDKSGANRRITAIGRDILSGWISLSDNGKYIVVPGYDAPLGETVVNKSSAVVNRVVALVDIDGKVNSETTANNPFSENAYRSAASIDGTDVWMSGGGVAGNGGLFHLTKGTNQGTHIGGMSIRQIRFYAGDLFMGDGARLYRVSAKNSTTPGTKFANITGDPRFKNGTGFIIVNLAGKDQPAKNVAYVMTFQEGIFKYSQVGNKWVFNGEYTDLKNLTGVEAKEENGKAKLFIISSANTRGGDGVLYEIADMSGHNEDINMGASKVLAKSNTGQTFRSLVWAPSN